MLFPQFLNHGTWRFLFLVVHEDQACFVIWGRGWYFRDTDCCSATRCTVVPMLRSLLHSASCSTLGTLASDADAFSTTAVASAVCQAEPGLVCTITANNISMIKSLAAPPKMVHTVLAACCIIFNHVPKRVKGAKADTVVDWGSCKAFLSTTSPQKFKRFKIADFNGDYHELQSLVNCIDLGVAASSASALVPIAKWVIAVADILEGQHLESPQSTPVKHLRPSKGKRSGSGKGTPVNAPKANRDR